MPEQRTRIHGRPVARSTPLEPRIEATGRRRLPGVYKLAGALRDNGLLDGLGALDGGVVVAPRYSDRIERLLDDGFFPIVLGGDCSVLIGNQLALRRRGAEKG